ncbi:hypothetical protein FSP39_003048 [Pinctada imbricata]|uniref:WH2 domain-containing protein n=1 Tax=Pinctada imbricata TaxID=66713 RepID=A0AA89C4Z8_PINIB|nr:hypothetical protein FSP39_003048 [Pinctada imbricata]
MPAAPIAPPPPPAGGSGRGDLLSQIQSGTKLNKVSTNENRPSPGGDRGNLLDQIKQGATLKKVEHEERPAVVQPTTGIAGALFKALNDRQKAIQGSGEFAIFISV